MSLPAPRHRLHPPVYFLLALGLMFGLHALAPMAQVVRGSWRLLGLVPIALALPLALSAIVAFRRRETPVLPFRQARVLVTGGPYRLTRNPMYLGLLLMLVGVGLLLGSLTPWLVIPLFMAVLTRLVIVPEEAMLEAAFGEEYRQYRQRVRRWV